MLCAGPLENKNSDLGSGFAKEVLVRRSQFLHDVRAVLGVPPWMLSVDARKSRELHSGACVQVLLHFAGPDANRLELDFTK